MTTRRGSVHGSATYKEGYITTCEEGISLEIREKISITGSQSYKEMVQLALRAEKLTGERMPQSNFQKRKGFNFMSGQSSKKSKSFESSGNSFGSGSGSVNSPSPSDLHNRPSWVHHHRVLLLEVEQ